MSGAAALLYFGLAARLALPAGGQIRVAWPLLAIAFAIAEIFAIHIEFRHDAHTFSLSELPLVIGLVFCDPAGIVLARMLGGLAGLALVRRQSLVKIAFNVSLFGLESAAAGVLYAAPLSAVGGPAAPGGAAMLGTTLSVNLVASTAVTTVIALATGRWGTTEFRRTAGAGAVTTTATTALALARIIQ